MKTILYLAREGSHVSTDAIAGLPKPAFDPCEVRLVPISCGEDGTVPDALWKDWLPHVDAVLLRRGVLDARMLECAGRCILIAHAGAGAGGIDLECARREGILVTSVPDFATKQYAALALDCVHGFIGSPPAGAKSHERRRRLGLIGLGEVGRAIARAALDEGWEVWAHDPFAPPERFLHARVMPMELDELLGSCEAVSAQFTRCPSAGPMLDARRLALMRRGAALVNLGPRHLVEMGAVVEALEKGGLGGVALMDDKDHKDCKDGKNNRDAKDAKDNSDGLETSIALLERDGRLRLLRPDFLGDRDVELETTRRALGLILDAFAGKAPHHLLIDPPQPRLFATPEVHADV